MTDDIDRRTAEREAALMASMDGQRRLARPEDYVFDKAQEQFWDLKDGTLHTEKGVDASIPQELWRVVVIEPPPQPEGAAPRRGRPPQRREQLVRPSLDIMRVENDQLVEGSSWWPGMPQLIRDWFINSDGFYQSPGRRIYNQYKPPPTPSGDPKKAGRWVEHVKKLWPDSREHEFFFDYCAHMLQRPHEKCNVGIVLSGEQGIGKDSALSAVKAAVGSWNTKGVDPDQLFSAYHPFLQTLMLVVDEVRPSKDEFHATALYNILKPLMAAPPNTLPINDKFVKLRYVINVLRVFITTNDWMAMYIPPDDRRMFIMHSVLEKGWHVEEGKPSYFADLFAWLDSGGNEHVAAWLAARDLSEFNPKAEAIKTVGWGAVAASWGEPEDGVLHALEQLGNPDALFASEMVSPQFDYQDEIASMIRSPRKIAHRLQRSGYILVEPIGERWLFRDGSGPVFRSRLAFVKKRFAGDISAARALIRERGKEIAARLAKIKDAA